VTKDWVAVLDAEDLPARGVVGVEVHGRPVALVVRDDELHAVGDVCSHAGGRFSEGGVGRGGSLRCPRHGAPFDPESGEPLGPPAGEAVPTYPVRLSDGAVEIAVDGG
jgi:3-phenylpropionate/trans-cinnamate dioxygenase ferredoxin subunit